MTDTGKNICHEIYAFIAESLSESVYDEIFLKTNFRDIGKFYYENILNNVSGSDEKLVDVVINTVVGKENVLNCKEDYYCELYRIIGIRQLPLETLKSIKEEYDKIFVQRYGAVRQKYNSVINDIDDNLEQVKTDIKKIKNDKHSDSFMRDLSTDENKFFELSTKYNSMRTQKEMWEFAFGYLNSRIEEFCDINDPVSVENAQKKQAFNLCKGNSYDAIAYFEPFRECIDILEDDIERPYALFFKIKIYIIVEMAKKSLCIHILNPMKKK